MRAADSFQETLSRTQLAPNQLLSPRCSAIQPRKHAPSSYERIGASISLALFTSAGTIEFVHEDSSYAMHHECLQVMTGAMLRVLGHSDGALVIDRYVPHWFRRADCSDVPMAAAGWHLATARPRAGAAATLFCRSEPSQPSGPRRPFLTTSPAIAATSSSQYSIAACALPTCRACSSASCRP